MRRGGRILLFLVVIIVILIAVTVLVLGSGRLPFGAPAATATPSNVKIYVTRQTINRDNQITAELLSTIDLPENLVYEWMIKDPQQIVGKYAAYTLKQGRLLSLDDVTDRPGGGAGSEAAKVISPGLVAISVPLNRLNSVAYGIRDGDRVNVIATTMFVDLDASFQTALLNHLGDVQGPGLDPRPNLTAGGAGGGAYPRIELDPTLNQAVSIIPSEPQRPRLVTQMVLQDIQVLHVGNFSLVPEAPAQATPAAGGQAAPTAAPVARPDIITLIVTPQDAVSITYLLYSGVKLSFTLRAPDDTTRAETEAATLQYLLSQYAIPIPAKLPYGMQSRVDTLIEPSLQGDVPTPRP
jgi:pilus assembly protein CpaB